MVVVNEKTYWVFSLTVRISSLGKVRLVISYENGKLTDTYVVLVTNAYYSKYFTQHSLL